LGLLAIWFCNSLRIALLIGIGSTWSPAVALGGLHSQAGWIFFNLVAISVAGLSLRSPFFTKENGASETVPLAASSNVTAYLGPFLVLMAANIIAAAFSDGFDWLYPVKVIATLVALMLFPHGWKMLTHVSSDGEPSRRWSMLSPVLNGVLVFILWIGLVWRADDPRGVPEVLSAVPPAMAIVWIFFRVFGSVVTVPLVEELAFRGYLMRRLASPEFESMALRAAPFWSVAISSLAFGLMHQHWFAGMLAGAAYAIAARGRNRLRDAVLAHAVTNGLIAVMVLTCDAWWLW
jgi:exosortase E/protease (VPEID-CTERM system)